MAPILVNVKYIWILCANFMKKLELQMDEDEMVVQ